MLNNIAEARRSYGLRFEAGRFTQEDAAHMLGVSVSTYKKWEQGQGKLNGEILCMLADAYDCSVDYLLCRTSHPDFRPVRTTPDEHELIRLYRTSDARGRAAIMRTAVGESGVEEQSPARAVGA